ncbi:MAG: primase-helicase zinc-binding domain-containing protein [Verrucomicrobiota bacterium]
MAGFDEVRNAARGGWVGILGGLGVDSGLLKDRHGPCPGCGGKDRFRFDDKDGSGSWICSQGGGGEAYGDGFDLLEHVHGWEKGRCLRAVAEAVGVKVGGGTYRSVEQGVVTRAPEPEKQAKRSPFDLAQLQHFAKGCYTKIDREWLAKRSPVGVEWGVREGLGADVLSYLYEPGERVLVFTNFRSQGDFLFWNQGTQRTYRLSDRRGVQAVKSELPTRADKGIWFLTNPVTGQWAVSPSGGKWGRRHGGCVTAWRYAVLESDDAPHDLWVKALVQLEIPISAIYTSGGKSIHALVRVDARGKAEFDVCRDKLVKALCPLGADGGALSGVRLSRLPGCHRGNKGMQELLWLNPQAQWGEKILDFGVKR